MIPNTDISVSHAPLPGTIAQEIGKIVGIDSIVSYLSCRACKMSTKLMKDNVCKQCKKKYEEGNLPQAFIAKVMVEKAQDEEPQMIKLFNSQSQKLIPQLPETDAEVSDSLFEMVRHSELISKCSCLKLSMFFFFSFLYLLFLTYRSAEWIHQPRRPFSVRCVLTP